MVQRFENRYTKLLLVVGIAIFLLIMFVFIYAPNRSSFRDAIRNTIVSEGGEYKFDKEGRFKQIYLNNLPSPELIDSLRLVAAELQDLSFTSLDASYTDILIKTGPYPRLKHLSLRNCSAIPTLSAENFPALDNLQFAHCQINGNSFGQLQNSRLVYLSIFGSSVSDEVLESISSIERLEELHFLKVKGVTEQGLSSLAKLKYLKGLSANHADTTGMAFEAFSEASPLKTLSLGDTQFDTTGCKYIAKLQQLETLDLGNTKVTDEGIRYLSALRKLKMLGLVGTSITDDGIKQLSALSELEKLGIANTNVTAKSATVLDQLPELWVVWAENTPLNDYQQIRYNRTYEKSDRE